MRKYERAKERRNSLTSVIKNTIVLKDDEQEQSRISDGQQNKGRNSNGYRKFDGERRHQSGRSGQTNRCPALEHQQNHAKEASGDFGLFAEDGRKHRVGCGIEGQESQELDSAFETSLKHVSNL